MATKSVRTIILENAVSPNPMKPRDLARHHGVSLQSVYRTATRLRVQGHLPPTPKKVGKPYSTKGEYVKKPGPIPVAVGTPERPPQSKVWVQADVDDIVNSEVMPELERLQKLSNMARFGPDAISIAAIKALEDLGRARGQSVGPGKPLTEDEQVARLARLCIALGRETSERAFAVAFPAKTEANVEFSEETSEEHPGTAPSDSGVGGLNP